MNYWLDIRLKLIDFFRKHKKKIFVIAVVWLVIIGINNMLKNQKKEAPKPKTTLDIHKPVMDQGDEVPSNYKEPINLLIDNFVNYCNNKEYEKAYDLLSTDYKTKYVKNIDEFKKYVDSKFATKKIYNIQNYSNFNNVYVYRVRYLEDILASGTTDSYTYEEEKITVKLDGKVLKLALGGYIGEEQLNIEAEDEYFKIKILKKEIFYEQVHYEVELTNKTSNYIVLADQTESNEIELKVGEKNRSLVTPMIYNIVMLKNQTITKTFAFERYPDENVKDNELIFNTVRILPKYTGVKAKAEEEKKNAIKLYSLTVDLNQNK